MPTRYSIGVATVVMLVLLRLNIGWHFFSEGVKHSTDTNWSSEAVLRAAKGPLAPMYRSYLPDFHHFEELLHGPTDENDAHAVQTWIDGVQTDWDTYRQEFAAHYGLNDAQQKQATKILKEHQAELRDWTAANKDAIATHVHEWQRKETTKATPAGDLPFQKKRVADKQAALNSEANGWLGELRRTETDYRNDLFSLLDDEQRGVKPLAHHVNSLDVVDDVMKYAILAIGLLLIVGLFTRLACLAGAAFLLSVVLMQPFWVSDTMPTFNQYVEMFALLTLATTEVGRWGGLDFFLPRLITGKCCSSKGKTDVSQS